MFHIVSALSVRKTILSYYQSRQTLLSVRILHLIVRDNDFSLM